MNPNASNWTPSLSAPTFVPGKGFVTATPASAPSPPPTVPPAQTDPPPNGAGAASAPGSSSAGSADVIDESDPLWHAVLKIAEGDRDRAVRMINNPDQLSQYPEIEQLLLAGDSYEAGGGGGDKSWEDNENDDVAAVSQVSHAVERMKIDEAASSPAPASMDVDEEMQVEAAPKVAMTEGDPREHLNLVFIGHVDAGKSTLAGNILYLTDNVDKRTIERYEKEAKERNRDSWFLAFIMDTNDEERAKGITVEVGKATFETEAKRYTILDAPGHKNYVPNMIQGASQADVGLLVISARKGEFETGFDRGGQTREHAMLAKTLGVSFLVVVVNKMDEPTVQWKKERFDECVTKIRPFLKSCGFVIKKEVKFIPVSGLGGANVKEEVDPKVCSWWKESYSKGENNTTVPTLLGLLDSLEIKDRNPDAPLRIPVLDRYTDRGTIAMGKVESGVVRPGMKVVVMPTRNTYKVDEVWAGETPVLAARPGENVLVRLSGARTEDVRKGFVLCTEPPCRAVNKIICQIAIADMPEHTRVMTAGFQCMFHAHTTEDECTVSKIFETTNSKGQVIKDARFASAGMRAVVMLELGQTVPVETYDHMPFLGRFTLRTEGKTVAIGKITKLPPKKD
jgi:peptide chain release factor subunit 3